MDAMDILNPQWNLHVKRMENVSLDAPDSEDMIISILDEHQYHKLCCDQPISRYKYFQMSTKHPIGVGILRSESQYETCARITEPLIIPEEELYWYHYEGAPGELLPNSWIRYDSRQIDTLELELKLSFFPYEIMEPWLAQANSIFAELEEVAHVKDYVCVNEVHFILQIAEKPDIPEGYLFVCPPQDFRVGIEPHANLYQWPDCSVYWSLDPSGADRLSTEDARILGFPAIHIETTIGGRSWDRNVYEGLRHFHEGKGLDPESREVARQLGYPLYEVLNDLDLASAPFPARSPDVDSLPGPCKQDDPAICEELGHYL
ncbi:hypothetical protein C8R45DRAFT_500990 [Mycena sanguinolenta]|nr:hypothetical protein C8R45DRAFT_500990 [Mycena sanguinolenta]